MKKKGAAVLPPMRPWSLAQDTSRYCSENELQSELHLSGRTKIAGGESCLLNHAKRGAVLLHHSAGLTKVSVIEEIEELGPKLNPDRFGDPRRLHHREIQILEVRSDDHVSSQIAEVTNRLSVHNRNRQGKRRRRRTRACQTRIAHHV